LGQIQEELKSLVNLKRSLDERSKSVQRLKGE